MLNKRMILNAYNEKHPEKKIRTNNELITKFVEMWEAGITNEMMLELIEKGIISDRETMLNPGFIKAAYESEHKVKEDPTPAAFDHNFTTVNLDPPGGGLMSGFESGIAQMVTQIVGNNLKPMLDEKFDDYVVNNPAKTRQTIELVNPVTGYSSTEVHHEKFKTVLAYVANRLNVLLVGPAGTGKTHLCKQVADYLGLDFYAVNSITQEYKLTGFIDANGRYHDTEFFRAFTGMFVDEDGKIKPIGNNGGLLAWDELDGSDPNALVTANGALSNGYMDFPCGRFEMAENFRAIACANTWGTGASAEYVGRYQLDAATRNRFGSIEIDYDENIEMSIANDKELVEFMHNFRNCCKKYGILHIASYRDIERLSVLKQVIGYKDAMKTGLLMNLEQDDLNMMYHDFENKVDDWSVTFCEIARGC